MEVNGRIAKKEHLSPSTEFKRGAIPWNKGRTYQRRDLPEPRLCATCGISKSASDYPSRCARQCINCSDEKKRKYRKTHPRDDWRKCYSKPYTKNRVNAWSRQHRQKIRLQIIEHYSPRMICQRCGHSDIRALSIDHINGGGCKHRKEVGGGSLQFYLWIIKNDFPDGYQILCGNCQTIKRWENNEGCGKQVGHDHPTARGRKDADYKRFKRQEIRKQVIQHYSHECKCQLCGESDFRVLTIDHVNGGGKRHLRKIGGTRHGSQLLYRWIIKNGFPDGFQILCCNCQWKKRWEKGECPIREKHK